MTCLLLPKVTIRQKKNTYHGVTISCKKRAMSDDLLTDLATSAATSAFNAVRHVFKKDSKKIIDQLAKEALIEMIKSDPNMTWTD